MSTEEQKTIYSVMDEIVRKLEEAYALNQELTPACGPDSDISDIQKHEKIDDLIEDAIALLGK